MKCFYLVGLLLLGTLSCKADENDLQDITKGGSDSSEEFFDELKDFFEKKCKAHGGEESIQKVTDSINSVKECVIDLIPDEPSKIKESLTAGGDSSEDICSTKRKELRGCFDDIVHVWESCSADDEKYIAQFFFDAVDALLDYICADDGAVVLSLFNEETFDCVFELIEQDNVTDICSDQFTFSKGERPEEIVETKEELCSDLSSLKTCSGDYLQQLCPKDNALRNALVGAINAISSPCQKRRRRNPLNLPLPYSRN